MILTCECNSRFEIPSSKIPKQGITVQCSVCGREWFQQFTNDENKIPIRIQADLLVGSIKADLNNYSGIVSPFLIKQKS